ncbi:MAG: M28 family peptidase [Planctomycetaceae bacterium]|nr:M28 family peptidase [Planctomycetaceae bacterium]
MLVDRNRLYHHVQRLTVVPRPAETPALEETRQYVTAELEAAGWDVHRHEFNARNENGRALKGINLVCTHEGQEPRSDVRFCVGAHLDSREETPGADDNASAVAALLEIARLLPQQWPANAAYELELVVFDLEEHGMLGGAEHARLSKLRPFDLAAMVSLEMLGYCDHRRNSQQLPKPLKGLYPDTGNFIAVIGNQNSRALIDAFVGGLRRVPELPVEHLQVPMNGELLQATRLSDHSPFWDAGYPALMITDTSFLRNPHYHLATDTIDTLDFEYLHQVAEGSLLATRDIIERGLR